MQKQALLIALGGVMALGASTLALGQNGFYGGVSMRDNGAESTGLQLGDTPLAWNRFTWSTESASASGPSIEI